MGAAGWVTADVPGMGPVAYSNKIPRGAQIGGTKTYWKGGCDGGQRVQSGVVRGV